MSMNKLNLVIPPWLEYKEAKEGYWTSERFMQQIKKVVKIAEFKFPRDIGWKIVWVFDHSSCHFSMPEDALFVPRMNVNPGGKQPVMRDGWWGGKPQCILTLKNSQRNASDSQRKGSQ